MTRHKSQWLSISLLLAAVPGFAGPPLICEPVNIGDARSLPWKDSGGWNGVDPSYRVAHLVTDTLVLLTPSTPVNVRQETLRRAALYAAHHTGMADRMTSHLLARVADAEAAGRSDPLAWFDAGYFVETVRQATFVYRHEMLSPAERQDWKLRGDATRIDGYAWVQKAIRLGGRGMSQALTKIEAYRRADLQTAATR